MDSTLGYSLFSQFKDEKNYIAHIPWQQLSKAIYDCAVIAEATEDEQIKSWVKSSLLDLLSIQVNAFRAVFSATVRTSDEAGDD